MPRLASVSALLVLLGCSRAVPGGAPRPGDPCAGAAIDAWGLCSRDGERMDPACCTPPPPKPCHERILRGCDIDGLCRWLVPGCGEPTVPEAACFPIDDCTEGSCAPGLACRTVMVDPCQGRPCGAACSATATVCLPASCAGDEVRSGAACLAPDGGERPASCCTWPCIPHGLFCAAVRPTCPPGEVPSVVGGCWGPCIPPDRCIETSDEELCRISGGIWDAQGCGHADCGRPPDCDAPVPGCVCPITDAFVPGQGCQPSDTCRAREGDPCGRDIDLPCAEGLTCRGGMCRR